MALSEKANILAGILLDAKEQDILLNWALIQIIRKRLNVSEEELAQIRREDELDRLEAEQQRRVWRDRGDI